MMGRVILGVTGSIAAYKSAELVRLLTKARIGVEVVMTRAATEFLTPLTLATLSGRPVTTAIFTPPEGLAPAHGSGGGELGAEGPAGSGEGWPSGIDRVGLLESRSSTRDASQIEHIRASRSADLIVVAPATANLLGKVAHGIADDALTTTILASSAPVLFAPAMNTLMWENPAVRANVALLQERGYAFVEPGTGDLACGEFGSGRMADPEEIADVVVRRLLALRPEAPTLLVTTGGTEEPLDPVRCLSNRSSGRMGFAVAEVARDRGYRVTVIAARTTVPVPFGIDLVRVGSAQEMAEAVGRLHRAHDLLVMAAAVADYRPRQVQSRKIEGGQASWSLPLVRTPDILASIRKEREGAVTIGFALQIGGTAATRRRAAQEKLERKGLDLVVLNDPSRSGSEFGSAQNQVTLIDSNGETALPLLTKEEVAARILDRGQALLLERRSTSSPAPKPGRGRLRRSAPGSDR